MLALGAAYRAKDEQAYLKQARKKLSKLRRTVDLFLEIQPEISSHTNFLMAAQSLSAAVGEISELLEVDN